MKTRIISGLIMAPLLIVIFIGGPLLKALVLVISVLAVIEFFNVHKKDDVYASIPIAVGSAVVLYAMSFLGVDPKFYILWLIASVFACLLYMFNIDKRLTEDATLTITGIIYVIFFAFHIAWITDLEGYEVFVWMVLITAFITDIAAYFSGYFFGKYHFFGQDKLCPKISPKKTREGAVGGVFWCALFSAGFGLLFTDGLWYHCLFMGIIGSIAAQFGDLSASIFKRKIDVKDYGHLIPGHGGVMDRIDSILFTAPVVFWYLQVFVVK
ncbi:MAG: phosphatidate cytidylyltransferase [Firmicutes bacterium]|nr:phosphatidate cytidylyltransferase [Clostridiales bacterium]MBQ4340637.1 phosphatidate cytidylyltransferase [Bacillota bacterium]